MEQMLVARPFYHNIYDGFEYFSLERACVV
jgi:hypothetical protein